MRHLADFPRWYGDVTESTGPARFARRSLLKAAVLGQPDEPEYPPLGTGEDAAWAATRALVYTVTGRILDVSPHILVLGTAWGEQRFPLDPAAAAGANRRSKIEQSLGLFPAAPCRRLHDPEAL